MTNPYQTPGSPVEDPQPPTGRPIWVWIICGFYGLGVVFMVILAPLMLGGAIPANEQDLDPTTWVVSLVNTAVTGAFVVQLFRLHAAAVPLCAAQMILTVVGLAWQILFVYPPGAEGLAFVTGSVAFSVGIDVVVLAYVVRLRGQGVLS